MNKNCPICTHRFYDVEDHDDVCVEHELWVVTKCIICNRYTFAEEPGMCMDCPTPVAE